MGNKENIARYAGLFFGIILNRWLWNMPLKDFIPEGFNFWRLISAVILAILFANLFQFVYKKLFAKEE